MKKVWTWLLGLLFAPKNSDEVKALPTPAVPLNAVNHDDEARIIIAADDWHGEHAILFNWGNMAAPPYRVSAVPPTRLGSAPRKQQCLAWLVLDRSGSMKVHGDDPRLMLNRVLGELRQATGAEHTLIGVVTFADTMSLEIPPQPAPTVPDLASFRADGSTALYGTVADVLSRSIEFVRRQAARGTDVKVVVNVLSDGQDTASGSAEGPCRDLVNQAKLAGFVLKVNGIGCSGTHLAYRLGFEVEQAKTFENTLEGLENSFVCTGESTSMVMANVFASMVRPKN